MMCCVNAVLRRRGCRWNRFRTLCDSNKKIGAVLELTADLPPEQEIERWTGEPVKALVVPTGIFITNKKGFPVLSRAHQNVVRVFLKACLDFTENMLRPVMFLANITGSLQLLEILEIYWNLIGPPGKLQNVGSKAVIHAVLESWLDGTVMSVGWSSSSRAQLEIVHTLLVVVMLLIKL